MILRPGPRLMLHPPNPRPTTPPPRATRYGKCRMRSARPTPTPLRTPQPHGCPSAHSSRRIMKRLYAPEFMLRAPAFLTPSLPIPLCAPSQTDPPLVARRDRRAARVGQSGIPGGPIRKGCRPVRLGSPGIKLTHYRYFPKVGIIIYMTQRSDSRSVSSCSLACCVSTPTGGRVSGGPGSGFRRLRNSLAIASPMRSLTKSLITERLSAWLRRLASRLAVDLHLWDLQEPTHRAVHAGELFRWLLMIFCT